MCLSIAIHRPHDVLAVGKHKGYEWSVIKNPMGFRCGYVKLPSGHPWHGANYDDIPVNVHGGLTFGEGDDDAYWIGFDCGHYMDLRDPDLMSQEYKEIREKIDAKMKLEFPHYSDLNVFSEGVIRTQEYVESECRKLIERSLRMERKAKRKKFCEIKN